MSWSGKYSCLQEYINQPPANNILTGGHFAFIIPFGKYFSLLLFVVFESGVYFRLFLVMLGFGRFRPFLNHAVNFFLEAGTASAALSFFIFLVHNQLFL